MVKLYVSLLIMRTCRFHHKERGDGCVPKVFTEIGGNPVELKTVRLGVISAIKLNQRKQLRFFFKRINEPQKQRIYHRN